MNDGGRGVRNGDNRDVGDGNWEGKHHLRLGMKDGKRREEGRTWASGEREGKVQGVVITVAQCLHPGMPVIMFL